jgi:cation diffusion facilitator family transporter
VRREAGSAAEQKRVAASSVLAAVVLTAAKLIVGILTGSLGVLSEAAHSGLDLLAAMMTWFSVHVSAKPADRDHPYGHEKIDNLSALFETVLLLVTCVWIIYEAIERLFVKPATVEVNAWSFGVILFAIAVDYSRSRVLLKVAKRTRSAALEADALHFSTDIASSAVVLAGLGLTRLGYPEADSLGALGVAVLVLWISFKLGCKAIDALLDRAPEDHEARVRRAVLAVPGVRGVYGVRVRQAGPRHFVDLKVVLDPRERLQGAHVVTDRVEEAVRGTFADADVLVHPEPDSSMELGIADAVALLAERLGASSHATTLHATRDGVEVDVHLEWPPDTSFAEAHRGGTEVEDRVRELFPAVHVVRTHLECAEPQALLSRDATAEHAGLVEAITDAVSAEPGVRGCREMRVLARDEKLWVAMTCTLDSDLSLRAVHDAATRIERAVARLRPDIETVSVHTEPTER